MYAPVAPPLSVKLTVLTSFATVVAFVGNGLPPDTNGRGGPVFAGVFCTTPGLLSALAHPTSRKSSTIPVAPDTKYFKLFLPVEVLQCLLLPARHADFGLPLQPYY